MGGRDRRLNLCLDFIVEVRNFKGMKITVDRLEAPFYLQAHNEEGNTLTMDAGPGIGGTGRGFRPMEMLLAALGGCSTIDIVHILQKAHQPLDDIQVEVDGKRQVGVEPSLYETIHVTYKLKGAFTDEAAQRAVDLSMTKYCSVAKTLEKTAAITWTWERV